MRRVQVMVCMFGLCCGAWSCGASQPEPRFSAAVEEEAPEEVGEASEEAPAPLVAPQCVDQNDEPVVCLDDSECCDGFVCSRDPELNRRVRYCVYGG